MSRGIPLVLMLRRIEEAIYCERDMCFFLLRLAVRDCTPWIANCHRPFYIAKLVHIQGHLVADARVRELLVADVVQPPLIMKVNRLTWVDEKHRMFIVSPRLQALDGVVALRDRIWPIGFLG